MADETTLSDEDIVTRVNGTHATAATSDDSGDVQDTGDDSGDVQDTGDDAGDVSDTGDTGDDGGAAA